MATLHRGVAPLAVASLLLTSACDTSCQEFCTAWFDYRQDVCGELDTDDARISCIADYRGHLVADEEQAVCTDLSAEVESLRNSSDPATRQSCCETSTCTLNAQPAN
jgi:hypothetical protein